MLLDVAQLRLRRPIRDKPNGYLRFTALVTKPGEICRLAAYATRNDLGIPALLKLSERPGLEGSIPNSDFRFPNSIQFVWRKAPKFRVGVEMAIEILVHHQETLGEIFRLEQDLFAFAWHLQDL